MARDVVNQLKRNTRKIFSYTRNIQELYGAGRLFKYEGKMPDTSHYHMIDHDIGPSNQAYLRALSTMVRSKTEKYGTFSRKDTEVVLMHCEELDKLLYSD